MFDKLTKHLYLYMPYGFAQKSLAPCALLISVAAFFTVDNYERYCEGINLQYIICCYVARTVVSNRPYAL